MRSPSIHIDQETLSKLIGDYFEEHNIKHSEELLANYLLRRGKKYSLNHRLRLEVNAKNKKKAESITYSSTKSAQMFSSILHTIKLQRKHKGISIIKEGNREWQFIKEGAALALDFSQAFGLKQREGYITYINLAFEVMGRFNLRQLNSKHEKICQIYEAKLSIEEDEFKDQTELAYNTYSEIVYNKSAISQDLKKQPDKYIYFVKAAEKARSIGINIKHYIIANFESLSWATGIPSPEQLITENAVTRVIKWVADNKEYVQRDTKPNVAERAKQIKQALKQARKK